MNKHVFIVLLSILGLIPVSLFSRSRVVNDTIFSKKSFYFLAFFVA